MGTPQPLDDGELARRAAHGNEPALAELVTRYRRYVYTIAYRIVLNEDDALDITQEALVRLMRQVGQFDGRGPFRAWVAAIASRQALTWVRKTASRREIVTAPEEIDDLLEAEETRSDNPRQAASAAEERRLVEAALIRLPPQQRAVFTLRFQEDWTPVQIAERLTIPAQQVRSQLHNAVTRLRELLAETPAGERSGR
ncbi:MAG TPA: sigma-70 family RNA polymerase sigma factor [Candidatus Sumerlaeota bacterium]|nr:sigma-70 family RNA polymerase sigma factor [Candidatus Sumerlaeota bacterium]HPS00872.1 sigma-70 family RNA polymerase sigma factor [Candidatus Sumerlaeota bacterium]